MAYVVGTHFGLPMPFTSDYLHSWGTTPDTLQAELSAVYTAADHIITTVHAMFPETIPPTEREVAAVREAQTAEARQSSARSAAARRPRRRPR